MAEENIGLDIQPACPECGCTLVVPEGQEHQHHLKAECILPLCHRADFYESNS